MSISATRRADKDRMKARARRLYVDHPRDEHYSDNLRRFRKGKERRRGDERHEEVR